MKRTLITLSTCLALVIAAAPAGAKQGAQDEEQPPPQKHKTSSYSGGSTSATPWGHPFGLGLQLGAPTALTGKLLLQPNSALVFSLGGGMSWVWGYGLELSVGYVVHPSSLASYEALDLNWYVGGALDVMLRGDRTYNRYFGYNYGYFGSSPLGLGAHVPVGLDFQLRAVPLSIYLELTPGIDIFPYLGLHLGGALGARFFF
ncbi:MAG: hypothetical protein JXR83_00710 [Deltaproteobacteria bacterium]|nr:hypothetical protein [Deltaproteobacteria bacterium]